MIQLEREPLSEEAVADHVAFANHLLTFLHEIKDMSLGSVNAVRDSVAHMIAERDRRRDGRR